MGTVIRSRRNAGFFSIFNGVLSTACKMGERDEEPIFVDYKSPLYSGAGENIWSSLFAQEEHSQPDVIEEQPALLQDRERLGSVYKREFAPHLREDLRSEIDGFIETEFGEDTLGVHVRSTDRSADPLVNRTYCHFEPEFILDEISGFLELNPQFDKIFFATDFLGYKTAARERFGDRLATYDATISDDLNASIHHDLAGAEAKKLRDVFIEASLLSRCGFLIRTMSNVSTASLIMNPDLGF